MTTNLNVNGAAMIEYHVFAALHAAKASSINIFLRGFSHIYTSCG